MMYFNLLFFQPADVAFFIIFLIFNLSVSTWEVSYLSAKEALQ